jgi:hypothetical protein
MGFRIQITQFASLLFVMFSVSTVAQKSNQAKIPVLLAIPAKASIEISGSDLHLNIKPGSSTEQRLTPISAGNVWLNYSSVVENEFRNTVYVSLNPGNLPAEISIQLQIGNDAGAGSGQVGTPTQPILLSTYPQPIVTNIGTCYTGRGQGKGHLLSYKWILDPQYDPELIKIEALQIETGVIYTIIEN